MAERVVIVCTICNSSNVSELVALAGGVRIMICGNCRNAFTFPKPNLPDYSREDFQAGPGDTEKLTLLENLPPEIQQSYAVQSELVKRNLPVGSAILEIGGGEGIFLDLLKKHGYNVELVEPSITASRRARQRGLIVHNDYYENNSFDKKYSLICMGHVLEHIDDPLAAIERIKTSLTPNGLIMLTQTNFRGFMPRFLKNNWYAWVPTQHFTHFSLSGLKFIAKRSSMSVLAYRYSRLVHGPSIYHKLLRHLPFLQDQIHILLRAN